MKWGAIIRYWVILVIALTGMLNSQDFLIQTYSNRLIGTTSIKSIVQDKWGVLWVAGRTGVACYDGLRWKNYTGDEGLSGHGFVAIDTDAKGNIWAVSRFPKIAVNTYDGVQWKSIEPPNAPYQVRYYINNMRLAEINGKTLLAISTIGHGLYLWNESEWRHFEADSGFISNNIYDIKVWKNHFYLASDKGIHRFDGNTLQAIFTDSPAKNDPTVFALAIDSIASKNNNLNTPTLWVRYNGGLGRLDAGGFQPFISAPRISRKNEGLRFVDNLCMTTDRCGNLYYSDPDGFKYFDAKRNSVEIIGKRNNFADDHIIALFTDYEGSIWAANSRGVDKLVSRRFTNFVPKHGLLEDEVSAIYESGKGDIWAGHDGGISHYNGKRWQNIPFRGKSGDKSNFQRVIDFTEDSRGNIWAVASSLGLIKIQPNSDQLQIYDRFPEKLLIATSLFVDAGDQLYIGGSNGLYAFKNGEFSEVDADIIGDRYIRKICRDSYGRLVLATGSNGLWVREYGQWTILGDSLSIYDLYCTNSGELLVGTDRGLFELASPRQETTLRRYRFGDFEMSSAVNLVSGDTGNALWLGSDRGIMHWDGKKLRNFEEISSIVGSEINRSAGMVDQQGRFWAGTKQGIFVYHPEFDNKNIPPPRVQLLPAEADGNILLLDRPQTLPANRNSIVFRFRCASFLNENQIRYRARLNGFDESDYIIENVEVGRLRYTNLPPGTYRFQLQAENAFGIWSDRIFSESIIIKKAFWQSWIFWLIIIAGLVAMGLYANWQVNKKIYTEQLEKEYREQTAELRNSEEKYRTIFENSKEAVFLFDAAGNILDVNQACLDMFGYEYPNIITDQNLAKDLMFTSEQHNLIMKMVDSRGFVKNRDIAMKHRSGQRIDVLATIYRINNVSENNALYSAILWDVSEKRKLEQQLMLAQKMESVGILAGGIAHDFNNILASILGYASFMKDRSLPEEQMQKYVNIIEQSAIRAADLTNQLLGFARGGKYESHPMNLNRLIRETLKMVTRTFEKSIEVIVDLEKELPNIDADPSQIHRVLMNLCINARDAMPGGGRLTLRTRQVTLNDKEIPVMVTTEVCQFVELTVRDTGVGINPSVLHRLFEPFYTSKEKGKGTGLGLSMVYGVVKNHGGFIEIDSEPGEGATFMVYLPVCDQPEEALPPEARAPQSGTESILVVDDDKLVRDFLNDMLTRSGYHVETAENGQEALRKYLQSTKVDLVILDMIMPKMGGEETLENLHAINPELKVLIATGYSQYADNQVTRLSAAGIMQKPFRVNALLTRVREILDSEPRAGQSDSGGAEREAQSGKR